MLGSRHPSLAFTPGLFFTLLPYYLCASISLNGSKQRPTTTGSSVSKPTPNKEFHEHLCTFGRPRQARVHMCVVVAPELHKRSQGSLETRSFMSTYVQFVTLAKQGYTCTFLSLLNCTNAPRPKLHIQSKTVVVILAFTKGFHRK